MTQFSENVKASPYFKASLSLSVLFILFYSFVAVSAGFAETVTITIAQTNNLNGRLFAYKSSG